MKALLYPQHGGPEVLRWHDVPIPEPGPGEVLIAVKAASINPTDIKLRNGQLKSGGDVFPRTMGMDFSGIVAKTGSQVSHLKMGDKVAGYTGPAGGAFADYAVADAQYVFPIPPATTYEEAACLPMNAGTALRVSNEYVRPRPGLDVLINGAAGGLGLFLVQYARLAGARVSGTSSGPHSLEVLRDLGITAIDYKETNVLAGAERWDVIVDTSGRLDFEQARHILKDQGIFATMVPRTDPHQPGRTDGLKQERLVFAVPTPAELNAVQGMVSRGELKAIVGKTYPMQEAIDALRAFESGRDPVTGKVVLIKS